MIPDSIKTDIEIALIRYFKQYQNFQWVEMKGGYVNNNSLIMNNDSPIAVCKFFPKDEIFRAESRFERETNALSLFGNTFSPHLIWKKKPNIIVYDYQVGEELLQMNVDFELKERILNTINEVHEIARKKRKPLREDVTRYYRTLLKLYSNSTLAYPNELLSKFDGLINEQEEFLDDYTEYLTFVHGDLVPPNFIIGDNIKLIDWEFFRPELSFFDLQYFNYYSKAHNLGIELKIKDEPAEFYTNLVDILEKLWSFGYLKRNKEISYHID